MSWPPAAGNCAGCRSSSIAAESINSARRHTALRTTVSLTLAGPGLRRSSTAPAPAVVLTGTQLLLSPGTLPLQASDCRRQPRQ